MSAFTRSAPWRGSARLLGWLGMSGRTLVIAMPMLWFLVFFLVPFFVLGRISLAEPLIALPPYTPLFERGPDGELEIIASLENYWFLWQDTLYRNAYLSSIRIAVISTSSRC
jgi:putrescine transport system permease protein